MSDDLFNKLIWKKLLTCFKWYVKLKHVIEAIESMTGRPLKTEYSFDEHKCVGSSIITIDAKTFAKSIRLI